jgi:hypothetical protein
MDGFRLLYLADKLDNHKDNGVRFDLRTWVLKKAKIKKKSTNWCGTAACAVGLAMLDKNFQAVGFGQDQPIINPVPTFKGRVGNGAVAELFDIGFAAVEYLFMPSSYPHQSGKRAAKAVAKRIREFVKNNGIVPDHVDTFDVPAAPWR